MNIFKTKKGTELPLLNLKGKAYLQVAHRLVFFREECPLWTIETELLTQSDQSAVCKATIRNEQGRIIATAHKEESAKDFPAGHREKCETAAIGRALALCGYGTQFEPELDEGSRIVDSPIQRGGVFPDQPGPDDGNTEPLYYKIPFGKFVGKTLEEVGADTLRDYVLYLEGMAQKKGKEMTGEAADFISRAEKFIGCFENRKENE